MSDAIKHITDDNFFFQEDSAQVHCVCNNPIEWKMWFSCFPILTGSAEAQVIGGGIVKRLLIAYFIGNISAQKFQNPFTCIKVIASQRWDLFLRHGVDAAYCYRQSSMVCLSFCQSGCPSLLWALQKWLNWSRCRFGCGPGWAQGTMY